MLSPKQVKSVRARPDAHAFTCEACEYVPSRDRTDDFVSAIIRDPNHPRYGEPLVRNLSWPVRCTDCERSKKRYQRMRRRLDRIWRLCDEQTAQVYRRPKLITFALPSVPVDESTADQEIQRLNKLLPRARQSLLENGVRGGTYVVECTTREVIDDQTGKMMFKHHAHVHMVAVAPFIHRDRLADFCTQLMPIGLGRINYVAPSGRRRDAIASVASYISKYLTKEGRTSRTFGIARRRSSE